MVLTAHSAYTFVHSGHIISSSNGHTLHRCWSIHAHTKIMIGTQCLQTHFLACAIHRGFHMDQRVLSFCTIHLPGFQFSGGMGREKGGDGVVWMFVGLAAIRFQWHCVPPMGNNFLSGPNVLPWWTEVKIGWKMGRRWWYTFESSVTDWRSTGMVW